MFKNGLQLLLSYLEHHRCARIVVQVRILVLMFSHFIQVKVVSTIAELVTEISTPGWGNSLTCSMRSFVDPCSLTTSVWGF